MDRPGVPRAESTGRGSSVMWVTNHLTQHQSVANKKIQRDLRATDARNCDY